MVVGPQYPGVEDRGVWKDMKNAGNLNDGSEDALDDVTVVPKAMTRMRVGKTLGTRMRK